MVVVVVGGVCVFGKDMGVVGGGCFCQFEVLEGILGILVRLFGLVWQ